LDSQSEPRRNTALDAARSTSLFKHRAFALFWTAKSLSALAAQAESVAIGWQVYTIARHVRSVEQSALLVGMVGLAQFAPLFALSLFGGVVADRCDRRGVMLACIAAEIACALALAAFGLHPNPDLGAIFLVAGLFGAARAFLSPASAAMGPMLVPREALARAISWNALGDQGGAILGPWLGGALCALSPAIAYGGSAALYAGAAGALLFVRTNTRPRPQPGSQWEQARAGLVYVWTNKIVLGATSLDLFAVLLGGATALLPIYARDVLQVGADGFGALRSGPAVGAAVMALALGRWPLRRHAGRWMFAGVAAFGVATLVFAVSRSLIVSVIALAALGAADMVSVYIRQSLVQIATPEAMRGRVSAASGLFISGSAELGEFETGLAVRLLGPVCAAIFGGLGALVAAGVWFWLFPSLRKADRLDGAEV
jgi:MFS family permease